MTTAISTGPHSRHARGASLRSESLAGVGFAFIVLWLTSPAFAQMGGFGFGQAVGGISIDAHGIVCTLEPEASQELAARRREILAKAGLPPGKAAALRKVSLARLCKAVDAFASAGTPLPADVVFLGGLERVTHVFVDPDGHDIVLAGPADTARIDPAGNVVAGTSGRPLLLLEDLVIALRAIDGRGPAGCAARSILRPRV